MNWKAFTIACVSAAATLLPANGITCGPTEDPHDYFTSFFSNSLGSGPVYKPFYYTSLLTFYDDEDYWDTKQDSLAGLNQKIAEEWKDYGQASSVKDAVQLVYFTKQGQLAALAESIKAGKALPASLAKNSLAQGLQKKGATEAVAYLIFAGKTEDISRADAWGDQPRDSLRLNNLIAEASNAYSKTIDPFLKDKYAFQRCKLAFYNNRNADCVRWYDAHFSDANTAAVNTLALSYKGGSLLQLRKKAEAAYAFSKTFSQSDEHKRKDYIGFLWATDYCKQALASSYLALCKNAAEKANMLALFALYGTEYRLDALQQLYSLYPASPLLPLLATREIAKLEEQYFTPALSKEKGGKALYINWEMDEQNTKQKTSGLLQAQKTAGFFEKLATDKAVPRSEVYGAGAAYLRFMTKDYEGAKAILAKTKAADGKTKDQLQMIQLLIAANEEKTITKEREAGLLPAIKWLVQKAKTNAEYNVFSRNFFSQILAQKYEQQGDAAKAALAYGLSELSVGNAKTSDEYYNYSTAIQFAREEMNTESLLKLYGIMTAPATEAEKYFVQNTSLKRDNVIDVIGTSHLRDRAYAKAIEWLSKAGKHKPLVETVYNYKTDKEVTVNVDPFLDYLNDWQRISKAAPVPYTKLSLAKKLLEMETKMASGTGVDDPSRLYYQYASALYNMSYYGNSWNAVAYSRTGGDWNDGAYKAPWEKEYYGVYTAKEFYQKAYDAATNKEFKAACLFMVAKCAQRQIPRPAYSYNNEAAYEKAEADFEKRFKYNPLFQKFKTEFGDTKFYQYAYNRCSYLRDYVKKENTGVKTTPAQGRKQ